MLDLENDFGAELGALLDYEGFLLELLQRIRTGQVHNDIWTARRLNRQRLDDAGAGVVRVGDGIAGGQAQRRLPPVQGLVIGVYKRRGRPVLARFSIDATWLGRKPDIEGVAVPSCLYSSMVFFCPTLKPSVLVGASSSS